MLELMKSRDDVLAITISGKITSNDLDAIMDCLDDKMSRHDKVHIFVETCAIDGIEIAGLPSYVARALPLIGQLKRFGRVAVVADQSWIRLGTRAESILLPGISYHTFLPEERSKALAWVEGDAN